MSEECSCIKSSNKGKFSAHLLLHEVRKDPKERDVDRAGEHLCPLLQPVQGFPDQLRLGSERGINDHHQFLTVDQEVLEDSIRFLSMEGVGVEEVEPDKFFRRVECLTREKTCLIKSNTSLIKKRLLSKCTCNLGSRSRSRDLVVAGRISKTEGHPTQSTSVKPSLETVSRKNSEVADEKKCCASFLSVACQNHMKDNGTKG